MNEREVARLEGIVAIQQRQIERLMDWKDAAQKAKCPKCGASWIGEFKP